MGKAQWIAVAGSLVFIVLLYVGFRTKTTSFQKVEESRVVVATSTTIESLLADARAKISGPEANRIVGLEKQLDQENPDVEVLKSLSSSWYALGQSAIAGHYAAEVATVEGTADAWSIAGTTFSLALEGSKDEKIRGYCAENGVIAFEKAISLAPEEIQHRINLALLYTEQPAAETPMQGILMLVDLNKQYPDDPAVLFHLGRLAIQTGQTEKALERLTKASELRPTHRETWCLLAQASEMAGDLPKAEKARQKCDSI